jgi:hypothetical protein
MSRAQDWDEFFRSGLRKVLALAEKQLIVQRSHFEAAQVVYEEVTVFRTDVGYDFFLLFESITQGAKQLPVGIEALEY